MRQTVSPAVAGIVIAIIVVIAALIGWKKMGPSEQISKPQSMADMMKKAGANPAPPGRTPGR